jgi:hypothetical protein
VPFPKGAISEVSVHLQTNIPQSYAAWSYLSGE